VNHSSSVMAKAKKSQVQKFRELAPLPRMRRIRSGLQPRAQKGGESPTAAEVSLRVGSAGEGDEDAC
jgi:hypothetical protein